MTYNIYYEQMRYDYKTHFLFASRTYLLQLQPEDPLRLSCCFLLLVVVVLLGYVVP
jgi:hypothetical protein